VILPSGAFMSMTLKGAAKEMMGTCVSMGCTVEGKGPREVQVEVDDGEYDDIFKD
jgi:large subunit ribosomal protein L11